jgi:hypothetical protein
LFVKRSSNAKAERKEKGEGARAHQALGPRHTTVTGHIAAVLLFAARIARLSLEVISGAIKPKT